MTLREYAAHRSVKLSAVQKAIATGRITPGKRGQVDPVHADREWAENSSPAKVAAATKGEVPHNLAAMQLRKETALCGLRELEYKQKSGELVDVVEMERAWASAGQAIRDALLSLPERIAAQLAAISDPLQVRDMLRREVRKIITDLPNQIQSASKKGVSDEKEGR